MTCYMLHTLHNLHTRFVSSCVLILPLRFSINSFSARKFSGYLSHNSPLNSICVFSITFCVSASNSCTKSFSLSYKIDFHWLLKSSEIGLIAWSFFILQPNGITWFSMLPYNFLRDVHNLIVYWINNPIFLSLLLEKPFHLV